MDNYSKQLEEILAHLKEESAACKKLLLHSCCAPCSSYVLEYLREYFDITVFYYNPNITEEPEYRRRAEEQKQLIARFNEQVEHACFDNMHSSGRAHRIQVLEGEYKTEDFLEIAKGLETCREGGERCFRCYQLRLAKTAETAALLGYDFFTTTLTISPLKNAEKLNQIGNQLAKEFHIPFLPSDFKKKDGYKRSVELSQLFELYRQDYCGCIYSLK